MITLKAEKRDIFGKKLKRLRSAGKLPLAAYGPGKENLSLFTEQKDFSKIYREVGESTMIGVETDAGRFEAIIQEVATHPVTGMPLHADLYLVERGKKIEVTVPFEFTGISEAVKHHGGILIKVMHEVDIEVLPSNIPHSIGVDISKLKMLDDAITIADLALPEGVEILAEPQEVVCSVTGQLEEEEGEAAAEIDFTAIEAEKKGKKEEVESSE